MDKRLLSRIGILGGTFDPIHFGHLVAAENVRHHFALQEVLFVPAGHPPHKEGREVSPAHHRYMMAVLATVANPYFFVSSLELDRSGPSYTIDTLRTFRKEYPNAELYFVTGADAILDLPTWEEPEAMLSIARFVAVARPGYPVGRFEAFRRWLTPALQDRVAYLEIPELAISSSDLRRRVREGRPVAYLTPEAVARYIHKQGLYR